MDGVKRTLQRNGKWGFWGHVLGNGELVKFQGRWSAFLCLNSAGVAGFLALLFLDFRSIGFCPPICQVCSIDTVECEDVSSLQDVLVALPSSTQQILLQQGNLSEIPPLSFSNFTNLYFLSITGFLVSSLADFTFFTPYINPLKVLDLSNNLLVSCTIEPLAFSSLFYLEDLDLANNSLDVLKGTWFMEMPKLKKLSLALNKIAYLPPRSFEDLNTLDELVVSSNMIQYLPMDAFWGLGSLTKLDLSINKILFINQEAFQPLQALQDLLLFQNRLSTLPTLPDSINFLLLHRNPWDCNCQLIQSMQSVEAKIQSPTEVTCERPPFLAGHQVTSSKLVGCAPSPSSYLSSPQVSSIDFQLSRSGTMKLICSLLGAFFLGFTVGLFCCYCLPKCCGCRSPIANQSKNEKALSSSRLKPSMNPREKTSRGESQMLPALRAAENPALEGGCSSRGTRCGPFVCASQICYRGQERFQSPLVAYLSMDPMGRSIVTLCEKGHEARCPVFSQPRYPAPQDHTNKGTQVSRDGGTRDQHCPTCMHGLRGSCVLPASMDQITRMQPVLGEQVDHQMNGQTLHPKVHIRDAQPLPPLVHINFPDGSAVKIEQNGTASRTSPSNRNESHQGRSHLQASPSCLRRKRSNHGHPYHPSQVGFASPENDLASDLRPWQESWTGRKDSRRPDLHLTFTSTPNQSQRWKRCPLHPTHEVASSPSPSTVSSQPEANRFHCLKEPCPRWFSVPHCPGKRARASQGFEKPQHVGETILGQRKSRIRQEDPRFLTRKESTQNRIWRCQHCGCEGSAPCSVNPRRCPQPGVGPRRTFLDASTQWSSTDAVRLKENEFALTFLAAPHNVAKTRSEERWLAACFPDFQPSSVRAHGPGEIDSIYEYPSPLVSTTSFQPPSVFAEGSVIESTWKCQGQSTDFVRVPDPEPMSIVDHLVDRWPPEKTAFRSLGEGVQRSGEILLEAIALDGEKLSSDSEGDPVTPSPVVSGFSFRTNPDPFLQELPVSIKTCSQVTFSAIPEGTDPKTHSIMTLCPLVQKMFQIDFPLPAEEEEEEEEEEEAKPFQGEEWDE